MAIKITNSQITIEKVVIENAIAAEYLTNLPANERERALVTALGIGIMAEIKGEVAHFLAEAEGELGKRLGSLKTLYELRELRFKETATKGKKAEVDVAKALKEIQSVAGITNDRIDDLSSIDGVIKSNKTGDLMVTVNGEDDRCIGIEVKLDKSVSLGSVENRNPRAKKDTAIGQLLEMRANRNTRGNIIVFDEDNVDASVKTACKLGVKYIEDVGFLVLISTQRGDFSNLAICYAIAREMVLVQLREDLIDHKSMKMIVERLLYLLGSYGSVKKEVAAIKNSAGKIESSLESLSEHIESTQNYLSHFLKKGRLTDSELYEFYSGEQLGLILNPLD
jgi:hypothetical protein